jgi:ATP-dependent helicase/nuclease subunit A
MPDHHLRERALAPNDSFIVQAPAGSGKTELLVRRFLVLLANVQNAPEEIIALTFTRKAAVEMRQRILQALKLATQAAPIEPYAHKTWQLASAAMAQNQRQQWNLLNNPHRLRIQTIDAFCASLTRQMPLLSGLGSQAKIADNADVIYLLAAKKLLANLEDQLPWSNTLAELLLHLDNRVDQLEQLLINMLTRRDQWLAYLIAHKKNRSATELRQMLEQGLQHIALESMQQCADSLPITCVPELLDLLSFAAKNSMEIDPSTIIADCHDCDKSLEPKLQNYTIWLAVANLLLTNKNTWRLKIDKNLGFPAEKKLEKKRFIDLLQQVNCDEHLRVALEQLRMVPPLYYNESQWCMLEVLIEILPILVAQLHVTFNEMAVVDFTEVSLAALRALGDPESPTDLAMILDYQIHHILVDEFQDTSTTQYRLLEQLICGWEPGDGRTVFVVGDPMQSIYRFRQAEVGLFLKAQQEGIGQIYLEPIQLQANFRSTSTLVDWVNRHFSRIFPAQADISSGAAPFNKSVAMHGAQQDSQVALIPCHDTNETTHAVVEIVMQHIKKDPQQNIAILVRSRPHLVKIITALKTAQIPFHAVEMESLSEQTIVLDLIALTAALLHLGDRLAWLAILRAPWCGLTLADLQILAGENHHETLWQKLQLFAELEGLSADGRKRLGAVVPVLKQSIAQQGRIKLRHLVEATWKALNGLACLGDAAELNAAMSYFAILENLQAQHELPNLDQTCLAEKVAQHHTTYAENPECKLVIMTIHKAKGLEFDTVIVPHLQRKNRVEEAQLLLWLDRPSAQNANDLILAPIKAKKVESDPIYNYLRHVEKQKSRYEMSRLLYVAVTRAKKSLYLLAEVNSEDNKLVAPSADSFLSLLEQAFAEQALQNLPTKEMPGREFPEKPVVQLCRLRYADMAPALDFSHSGFYENLNAVSISSHGISTESRQVGILIHRILQQINEEGLDSWDLPRIIQQQNYWKKTLLQSGVIPNQLDQALQEVTAAIKLSLQDPRGRWILACQAQEHSEWALTAVIAGVTQQIVIDRTFVDEQGIRWIIDFKTGSLDDKLKLYQQQLEGYAAVLWQLEQRPIRLGLYFPGFGGWQEWGYAALPLSQSEI